MTKSVSGIVPDWTNSLVFDPRNRPIGIESVIEHVAMGELGMSGHQEATLRVLAASGELGMFMTSNGIETIVLRVGDVIRPASASLADAFVYIATVMYDERAFALRVLRPDFFKRAVHCGGASSISRADCAPPEVRLSKSTRLTLVQARSDRGYTMVDVRTGSAEEGGTSAWTTMGGLTSLSNDLVSLKRRQR